MKTILESSEIIAFLVKRYAKDKPTINFSIEKIYQIAQDVEVSSPSIFVDINRRSLEAFGTKYRKHINVKSHSIQIELNNESIKELLNDNRLKNYHELVLSQVTIKYPKNYFEDSLEYK